MPSPRTIQSIYTDGACTGNPGPGGWGVVVYFNDHTIHELGGNEAQTTNNRMEMQAAIAALKLLSAAKISEPITLHTDSEYLIKGVTQWVKGWKKKGWKTREGKPVLNQDLWEILDELNTQGFVKWQHVRGHAGNVGNERCDAIARAFANGKAPFLQQLSTISDESTVEVADLPVVGVSDLDDTPKISYKTTQANCLADTNMTDSPTHSFAAVSDEIPREMRVVQLRNLVDTLRIADEISVKGYLITSSELADLMDVHSSAVTSRGDEWRWRNWIVSRVRREGNQILWELERGDQVTEDLVGSKELNTSDPATE